MRPLLAISLETIQHDGPLEATDFQFVVNNPIPKSLMRGVIPEGEEGKYVVISEPEIVFPNPDALH